MCYFVSSRTLRTPDNFQAHLSIFQGSRAQRDFKANSRTILEIQGRLATLETMYPLNPPFAGPDYYQERHIVTDWILITSASSINNMFGII